MTEDDAKNLYAHFGITAYRGQCLEMEAGTLLFAFIQTNSRITAEEAQKAIETSIERETSGHLLKEIKKIVHFEESGLATVDDALKKRNYLVHHFFRTHALDMLSEAGRSKMINELEDIRQSFDDADALLHVITITLLKTTGITEEDLRANSMKR